MQRSLLLGWSSDVGPRIQRVGHSARRVISSADSAHLQELGIAKKNRVSLPGPLVSFFFRDGECGAVRPGGTRHSHLSESVSNGWWHSADACPHA